MLQISPWSRAITYLILVLGLIIALPNALPNSVLTRLPHWWPTNTVSLGLDLQGGSYLLLEVELDQVQKDPSQRHVALNRDDVEGPGCCYDCVALTGFGGVVGQEVGHPRARRHLPLCLGILL